MNKNVKKDYGDIDFYIFLMKYKKLSNYERFNSFCTQLFTPLSMTLCHHEVLIILFRFKNTLIVNYYVFTKIIQ